MPDHRCPDMPPGMHPYLRTTIGAQYHRCRFDVGHEPPCANNVGVTWGFATPDPAARSHRPDAQTAQIAEESHE